MSEKLFSYAFTAMLVFFGAYMATKRPLFGIIGFILLIVACVFRFASGRKNRDLAYFKKRDERKTKIQSYVHISEEEQADEE